jgi:hypothetical protein
MKAVKKKVTRKETKKPSVAKHFVYAGSTPKKVVKSPLPKVASAIDSNKTKKKPSKLKKRIVESAFPPPCTISGSKSDQQSTALDGAAVRQVGIGVTLVFTICHPVVPVPQSGW